MSKNLVTERALCNRRGVNYLSSSTDSFAIPILLGESPNDPKHLVQVTKVVKSSDFRSDGYVTRIVSQYELEDHKEVRYVSLSPDGRVLLVVNNSHEILFIDSKACKVWRKIDLSHYNKSTAIKSIIWMNSSMKMVIIVWNDRFLCVSLDQHQQVNVLRHHRGIDFAMTTNNGNIFCIISGEQIIFIKDVMNYTEGCSHGVAASTTKSVSSSLQSLTIGQTKFVGATAVNDSIIAFKHFASSADSDIDPIVKAKSSSSNNANNATGGGFKHILSGTSIRDALHVPASEEDEDAQLIIPSNNSNISIGQGCFNMVEDISNGLNSMPLIQEINKHDGDAVQSSNSKHLSFKPEKISDQSSFIVQKRDSEKTYYTLSSDDPKEDEHTKNFDIMCCCACGADEYLVALGSGLGGKIYVYKLSQLRAIIAMKIDLEDDHTCKGLSFVDSSRKTKCLHILIGIKKETKGASGLTSVSLRCEYELFSNLVDVKVDEDLSTSVYKHKFEDPSFDLAGLVALVGEMKESFQFSLSKIEKKLEEQHDMIQVLNEKLDAIQYSTSRNVNSTTSGISNVVAGEYKNTKLNQNSPSRQYVGHIQERGKINVNLLKK